jgi:hypothetical protein
VGHHGLPDAAGRIPSSALDAEHSLHSASARHGCARVPALATDELLRGCRWRWPEFRLWLDSQLQSYSRQAGRAPENDCPPWTMSSASKRACPEDSCLPPRLRFKPTTPTRPAPAVPVMPLDPERRNFLATLAARPPATPPATWSAEQPEKVPDRQLVRGACLHCWDAGEGDVGTSTGSHWKVVLLWASLSCAECG